MSQKRIKTKRSTPRQRRWVAIGTLAAFSAFGGECTLQAGEQKFNPPVQALPLRRFAIAAGPLDDVLAQFGAIFGTPVRSEQTGIGQIWSPGASGEMSAAQALDTLLAGTGLAASWQVAVPTLTFKPQSLTVEVNDVAPTLSQSLPKYQQILLDTPQTITVVSEQTLSEQGVTTLRDALRNVGGISLAAGEGGAQGDNLTVRGFSARNDLFVDGMRDFGSYYRDSFNTEEVQVLQGPSSVAFGRGSTGGVVNQASKTPQLNQSLSADLQFGSDATRRADLDWSVPLPKLGRGAAMRLTAMGNLSGVAERDRATNRRTGMAPSLAFGLGSPTRITLSYFHQNEDNIPDYGLPWLFNQPAAVNRNNYYGLPGNYLRTYADMGTARVEHDWNEHVTLRDQIRYANYDRAVVVTEPKIPASVTAATPLDQITVTRNEIAVKSTEASLDNQTDVVAHFSMYGIRHTLVSGIEVSREISDPTRYTYQAPSTSLLNPAYAGALGPGSVNSAVRNTATSVDVYALETAELGPYFQASGGIRYDRFDDRNAQAMGAQGSFTRVDAEPTWRAALVFKPAQNLSVYADAGTSFNPSAETLSLSAGTANLPPENNRTIEAGSKWEIGRKRVEFDAAVFRTTKNNARESDPANSLLVVLAGTQRVSGSVANIHAHVTKTWDLVASYSYLNSRIVSSRFYPESVGYALANVPPQTLSIWSSGHLPWGFRGGAGTNFVDRRSASSTTPIDSLTGLVKAVPGYWTISAMLSHSLGEHVEFQVNGYNLANRFYYDQLHPGHVIPGPGRSLLFDLKFKF